MSRLDDILSEKRREIAALKSSGAPSSSRQSGPPRDVRSALRRTEGGPLRLIAEVKFRSPSAGVLSTEGNAEIRAGAYVRGGAAMVSVLTDARWFGGSFSDLERVREHIPVPVLCKDFLIDPVQIHRAWSAGADAALIIVRCVEPGALLSELIDAARTLAIEPFVEVFNEVELERALTAKASVIGVNARDLDALTIDIERAALLLASIPASTVAVHLSGLRVPGDAQKLARTRADAALVGEALMRQADPEPLLRAMIAAAS